MGNVLESVTLEKYPAISEIKTVMKENGAWNALMSGSGPTVFGIYEEQADMEKAAELLRAKKLAKQIFMTTVKGIE
ncbi:MAG: 4-(cytidine 5'-diphospho)-2-C-methyl-D-erythritol kinase, partial [Lachnospiraceae bacterium]|nr:4-(cytidine 5'-diphospho)-2-C-methyl-D-erythritol kinase [Lachnospiraceae bacterium]